MKHPLNNLTMTRKAHHGFTIIELIVAVGVASLLLFMVNFIFNDATRAVSRGIALSDIIADTRGGSDQFDIDAAVMVGPTTSPATEAGGFQVIANHQINAQVRRGPRLREEAATVRADQLVFIRLRDDGSNRLLPMTPKTNGTFQNDFLRDTNDPNSGYTAEHVKVWFGHVQLTTSVGASGGALGSGSNRIANDWVLGRQAMFLVDESPGNQAIPNNHIHAAASARFNESVGGYGTHKPPVATVPDLVYAGLTDMAGQVLGPQSVAGSINQLLGATASNAAYRTAAYNYAYLSQRLWANPAPRVDNSGDLYGIAAWQVAQMHPIFLNHVSDFIVEFAADTDLDGEIDTHDHDGSNATPEIIKWYVDDDFANEPGTGGYDASRPATYPLPAGSAYRTAVYDTNPPGGAAGAFVWRHDDANFLVQTDSATYPNQPSFWPYMIRIRYRMHDSRGVIESGDNQHGMWFEHVIRVKRP